ncbi:MAG: hypothetical protein ACQKBU_00695 [Verrucomicrobiales bacterium]
MRAIDQKVGAVLGDEEVLLLFDELRRVTGVHYEDYTDFTVYQYLQQCVYPNGPEKAVRIRRECINKVDDFDEFLLLKKAGKVGDNLHRLLRGLTPNLDNFAGVSIYMLLNRSLIPTKKRVHRRFFHPEQ